MELTEGKIRAHHRHSAQALTCQSLCEVMIDQGYSAASLSDSLGLGLEQLDHEESRVPLQAYYRLWHQAVEASEHEALALELAQQNVMHGMGLVGHIFFNCKTLHSAILHYQRYYGLVNESIELALVEHNGLARLEYTVKTGAEYSRYEMEYSLALAGLRAKALLQSGLDLEYVCFAHRAPAYAARYEALFQCPVRFEQPSAAIVFDAAYLNFKMPRTSPSLYKVLNAHLERLLGRMARSYSVADQVSSIVRKKMSDPALDADYVAGCLNMSRNTLYRRLKKEGQSYNDIVAEVKKQFAIASLQDRRHSMTELAFLLGFSEVSAFSRAFKRWTGEAPNMYSKQDS